MASIRKENIKMTAQVRKFGDKVRDHDGCGSSKQEVVYTCSEGETEMLWTCAMLGIPVTGCCERSYQATGKENDQR